MKYLVMLCDGMADEPNLNLQNKTPMQLAKKPCMDKLAKTAELGMVKTVADNMSPGSDVTDTVRNVFYVKVLKNGTDIDVKICADGFLYNMVRIIVGTLIEVAYDRMKPEDINDVIDSCDRRNAGMTAPPEGLYLNKVSY